MQSVINRFLCCCNIHAEKVHIKRHKDAVGKRRDGFSSPELIIIRLFDSRKTSFCIGLTLTHRTCRLIILPALYYAVVCLPPSNCCACAICMYVCMQEWAIAEVLFNIDVLRLSSCCLFNISLQSNRWKGSKSMRFVFAFNGACKRSFQSHSHSFWN